MGTSKTIRYPVDITVKDNSEMKKLTDVFTFNKTNAWAGRRRSGRFAVGALRTEVG
ncbi:hypothetical protein ACFV2H_43535 [Streptomyces sp. NPDC059629]|uniref:hypothetical protein n=1 Tax=Streptomyces sp. NPDC059629 TaxID=3346889 RepID=UPI0036A4E236